MKLVTSFALFALLLLTPACETLGDVAQGVNINSLLASVTNAQSANDAKPVLDSAVAQLSTALDGAKAKAANAAEGAVTEGVQTVLTQFGVTPETTGTISTLLGNPSIKGVLGGTLNQLMGMISI